MDKSKELGAGMLFTVVGLYLLIEGASYRIGTPARMGPGFFPVMISALLLGLGVAQIVLALRKAGHIKISFHDLRSVTMITASVVIFAATLMSLGLLVAITASVTISTLATSKGFSARGTPLLAAVLCLLCSLVFVYGLGLQLPYLPRI